MLLLTLDLLEICVLGLQLNGAEVFHAIRSCYQWSVGSVVPVLVRRMLFCPVASEFYAPSHKR